MPEGEEGGGGGGEGGGDKITVVKRWDSDPGSLLGEIDRHHHQQPCGGGGGGGGHDGYEDNGISVPLYAVKADHHGGEPEGTSSICGYGIAVV